MADQDLKLSLFSFFHFPFPLLSFLLPSPFSSPLFPPLLPFPSLLLPLLPPPPPSLSFSFHPLLSYPTLFHYHTLAKMKTPSSLENILTIFIVSSVKALVHELTHHLRCSLSTSSPFSLCICSSTPAGGWVSWWSPWRQQTHTLLWL